MIIQAVMMRTTAGQSVFSVNVPISFFGLCNVKILDITSNFTTFANTATFYQVVSLTSNKLKLANTNIIRYLQKPGSFFVPTPVNYANVEGSFFGSDFEFKNILLDGFIDFRATIPIGVNNHGYIIITMDIEKS